MPPVVKLVGLDFGTTTSSAVVASARLARNCVTGRVELEEVREGYRSELVFTPVQDGDRLDEQRLAGYLDAWLAAGGVGDEEIFGGGALLTGLTARKANASALARLVRRRLGDALVAAADDPCLESWLAFQGSAAGLSREHPEVPILNLDVGGGTTNLALGRAGEVLRTGCLFVGARHVQVEPGTYHIVKLSPQAGALFDRLGIHKAPGDKLAAPETDAVLDFYLSLLEAAVAGRAEVFADPVAGLHQQVAFRPLADTAGAVVTFSGGVGELVYRHLDGTPWPAATCYGDLGIDLARRIAASPLWPAARPGRARLLLWAPRARRIAVKTLTPFADIAAPGPRPDEVYATRCFDRDVSFRGLKHLLGAADFSKAGDRNAGLAAPTETVREAARAILSELTVQHLYDRPLTDDEGRIDAVMRVNYDVDHPAFASVAELTLGQLKDRLLRAPGEEVSRIGRGLTGVMAAALAKLCDVHELILIARKVAHPTKARTLLGAPGTLSSRLQPNHPTDDLRGITLLVYWGLSLGAGDALIGLNPAVDTVENVSAVLRHLDLLRRRTGAPTQICVLAHIKTQLACLEQGAPVEILFQSLAGTERTNLLEFDISVDLLDRGYRTMAERGPLRDVARQFMYFETGQGSEFSYGKHNGIDMTTTEALCYGLARRYDPFMVNNVTGFIGPETHRDSFEMILANLQDHFMGKLLGLPMGMAPCYTLHSHITLEGQQMATQLLTAAGANYYMDVGLNTDRMLAYFDTSGHDDQALREVHGRRPAAEFLEWALGRGIFARDAAGAVVRGPHWGDVRQFCESDAELEALRAATPAVHGFGTAGPRPANAVARQVRLHQGVGREAIRAELRVEELGRGAPFRLLETAAADKEAHLGAPDLGARLAPASRAALGPEGRPVQILVSDGLSAEAVHHNIPELLPVLRDGLAARGLGTGRPLLARYGRVKLAEEVAELLGADLVVHLIGERPGGDALASRSLSAYLVYRLGDPEVQRQAARFSGSPGIRFEYTVVSNIYAGGLPPAEAAGVLVERVGAILSHRAAGNRLEALLGPGPAG